MAMIFALSSIAHPPDLPAAVSDKSAHALLYFGLGALLVRARAGGWRRPVTLAVAVVAVVWATVYGASDEMHQHFVPPRQTELTDLLADAVGAAGAAATLYAWSRIAQTGRTRAGGAEAERRRGV